MTKEINNCIHTLNEGGLILYPTDTVWGIGCDATNEKAVDKIYQLIQNNNDKALVCLVANDAMLEKHVETVPDLAYDIMDLSTTPTTILYDRPRGVSKNLIAFDGTIAIRVASDKFCQYLINKFKKPIVAASANISGKAIPKSFKEINEAILSGVDYVVNLYQDNKTEKPSTIIKLGNDNTVKVVRK
ncbi:L-threonylcarbamoyladenylate synthase [Costertonia aggregata]|uniref:L-threonylcarbamoyladenylate synthase n=1 Tax=Costertonia aggregata TaxID=343403 RepID=A0A7H9AS98_9FLAO|nr:L-threonylcarbamoyladenylate synthase [Costertonia aggregata]QLG46324.1 threonylcarbamoyl-AMP synthase [Costertonia aggregata]